MKLAFISGNLCHGGAQRVIAVISSHLAEKGLDVYLLLFSRNETEYALSPKVKVTYMADSFEEYSKISVISKLKALRKYLREIAPDVAVGFMEGGYALYLSSLGMKIKKISSVRINPKYLFKFKGFRSAVDRIWFSRSDAVVIQTDSQRRFLPKKIAKKSVVIPNPVSHETLGNAKADINAQCRRIIMVGRLTAQKNYPMAFDALKKVVAKYPNVTLDVFGKGLMRGKLKALIENKGLSKNIRLCGWSKNVSEEYKNYDLYVLSSDYEGMPNSLMEAMAVGLPCISADCDTGPADLIENGKNGFLVPCGNSSALADRIIQIIEMTPEKRVELGRNAHTTIVDNYTEILISQKWENLFVKLLNGDKSNDF